MANEERRVALAGSERPPLTGSSPAGAPEPTEAAAVSLFLAPAEGAPGAELVDQIGGTPVSDRQHLSREDLARRRASPDEDLEAVARFAADHGLIVSESQAAARRVELRGTLGQLADAFGVTLQHFDHPSGRYRTHAGPVMLPESVASRVVAVLGLDDRPAARPQFRLASAPTVSYTPPQVAAAYGFPFGVDCSGLTIALIELGGGFNPADVSAYFGKLGLKAPAVEAVPVGTGSNSPTGTVDGPDGEVMLDIEVAGSVATGASLAVYFAPNTDKGFADAISAAVHDTVRKPAVISISWGGPEDGYSASARQAFEAAFTDAALAGVTVCAASGDSGSTDGQTDGAAHVDYPASSPQVLGCGGTSLRASGATIQSEVVWDDLPQGGASGGGVSAAFPVPSWQSHAGVPASANPGGGSGRGVPDVAGDADPATGYQVRVDGQDTVIGGTSAVAPLWAALVTLAVRRAGKPVGFINPLLYGSPASFHDVTSGTNGSYSAGPGWDPCTGLGSPDGSAIVTLLGG